MSSLLSYPLTNGWIPLSDIVSSIITIMSSDVVHAGTASTIHMQAAQTNIAIIRCWMGVSSAMPNVSVGSNAIVRAIKDIKPTLM
jgi:hypothetical protein